LAEGLGHNLEFARCPRLACWGRDYRGTWRWSCAQRVRAAGTPAASLRTVRVTPPTANVHTTGPSARPVTWNAPLLTSFWQKAVACGPLASMLSVWPFDETTQLAVDRAPLLVTLLLLTAEDPPLALLVTLLLLTAEDPPPALLVTLLLLLTAEDPAPVSVLPSTAALVHPDAMTRADASAPIRTPFLI
jgi:hypothetical protein